MKEEYCKIERYLQEGRSLTIRNHVTISCRVNDLIFQSIIENNNLFTPYILLSQEAYESLKKKRYGKIIDTSCQNSVDFLYNVFNFRDIEDRLITVKELFVIRKEDCNLYRILGYYRLGSCIACTERNVLEAMKKYLMKYHIEIKCVRPKVFREAILYIE